MATARSSPALLVAAALDVIAAAALFLPWWRAGREPVLLTVGPTRALDADTWAGWEVVGGLRAALLVALVVAGAVAAVTAGVRSGGFGAGRVRSSRWRVVVRVLIVAAGAAAAVVGVSVLARWGISGAPGAWVAALAGIGAAALAVPTVSHRGASVALVVAIAVVVLPGPPPRPDVERRDGPFVRLAGFDAAAFRSGTPGLAASPVDPRLVVVDGAPAVAAADGLVRVGPNGRAEMLARIPDRGVPLGVAGNRVARWVDATTIVITGLRAGDPLAVTVRNVGVGQASAVGTDGSLWLAAIGDPAGTIRRLDLAAFREPQTLDATFLPVVTIGVPDGIEALDPDDVVPVPGGAVRATGNRLERLTPTPSGVDVAVLAGGRDPACGLTRTALDAYLPSIGPHTVDGTGGIWQAVAPEHGTTGRLVRVNAAGVLHVVPHPLPGRVSALMATPDGSITMITRDPDGPALWQLPDAAAALTDLPPTPVGCIPSPPPVGPAVGLVPVANLSGEPRGVLLGVDGRFARGGRGPVADITAVTPDRREIPLGARRDGEPGAILPDGTGGVWWLEPAADPGRVVLVHGRPGLPEERLPPVTRPGPAEGSTLITDLGGRPPLLGTADGAYRIGGGEVVRVLEGPVTGGVVRADGRGWLLADGRLVAVDGDRVLGPVIDAGGRRGAPVDVQLATGVAPAELSLPDPSVGLDAGGRAIVVSGGVVLAVDDAGVVRVVAQDPRLEAVVAVEGGLATAAGPTRLRVDLPG